MAFRIQDLMMDVRPFHMANPECTCQITVKPGVQREPGTPPGEEPGGHRTWKCPGGPDGPDDNPACVDTVLPSRDCPPGRDARAGLAMLRAQLRHDLGLGL